MAWGWLVRLGLVALLSAATPAMATWYEARSRHFVVYSEGTPASVGKFSADLERFDQGLRKLLGYGDVSGDDPNPVTVFAVDDISDITALCKGGSKNAKSCSDIAGFYNARVSGSVAFVPRRAGSGTFDLNARTILFHEYAHHLMLANSGALYPAWYVEGFAEFVSNAKLDKENEVGIGLPANSRAYSLVDSAASLSALELLTLKPWGLSRERGALFYGRAWLLTHMLAFSVERKGQLEEYLAAINKGVPGAEAASAAFGDLDKLEKDMRAYLQRRKMNYLALPVSPLGSDAVRVRPLSAGEAALMSIRLQSRRGVDNDTAPIVAAEARKIAAALSHDVGAQTILAEAELDADNLPAAEAAVDRILAKSPNDMTALVYKSLILTRRARLAEARDEATWKEVRKWLTKANRAENDAAWPLFLFYQSFQMQGIRPTKNAAAALERAFLLVPQDSSVRWTLVHQMLNDERIAEARTVLAPLAFNPHLRPGNRATKLLELLDSKDKEGIKSLEVSGAEEAE